MRIVHIGKFYPPEWGGIESITHGLAVEHAAASHDVTVVCFTRGGATVTVGNPEIIRIKARYEKASQPLSFDYIRKAIAVAKKADIVHIHAPNLLAYLVACAIPRKTKVVIQWHADIAGKGLLGKIVRPLERYALSRADAVVSTTPVYADFSHQLRNYKDKLHMIPLGISSAPPVSQEKSRAKYVLFVGRLVPYKGLPVLIEAIKNVKADARFLIVGEGPEEARLKDMARTLGVDQRIDFLGRTDQDTLASLYANARVFCLPSVNRLEAFGVVLLEAMRAGVPLITTDIAGSGVSWVNQHDVSGKVVTVNDPRALATAIDDMLAQDAQHIRLSQGAKARFDQEFTQTIMAQRFAALYKAL